MSLPFLFTMLLLYTIIRPRFMRQFVAVHSVGVGDSTTLWRDSVTENLSFCLMRFQCRSAHSCNIFTSRKNHAIISAKLHGRDENGEIGISRRCGRAWAPQCTVQRQGQDYGRKHSRLASYKQARGCHRCGRQRRTLAGFVCVQLKNRSATTNICPERRSMSVPSIAGESQEMLIFAQEYCKKYTRSWLRAVDGQRLTAAAQKALLRHRLRVRRRNAYVRQVK